MGNTAPPVSSRTLNMLLLKIFHWQLIFTRQSSLDEALTLIDSPVVVKSSPPAGILFPLFKLSMSFKLPAALAILPAKDLIPVARFPPILSLMLALMSAPRLFGFKFPPRLVAPTDCDSEVMLL